MFGNIKFRVQVISKYKVKDRKKIDHLTIKHKFIKNTNH